MKKKDTRKPSGTDWKRVESTRDEEIDTSDIPELNDQFFSKAVFWPGPKKQITLRLDPDVLDFFKRQGRGYQRNINSVLRRYMELRGHRPHAS